MLNTPSMSNFINLYQSESMSTSSESKLSSSYHSLLTTPSTAFDIQHFLTFILLMWTFGRAPNNASKWKMGFNSVA
jgi:hypothetical protein